VSRFHPVEHAVGLMHRDHRRFGNGVELRVGDHDRDLDDAIGIGLQAGHFHVQPDEVILILCHNRPPPLSKGAIVA